MMAGENLNSVKVLEFMEAGTKGLEIGVWKGDSSKLFLMRAKHLTLVDAWSTTVYEEGTEFDTADYYKRYRHIAKGKRKEHFVKMYDDVYESVVERFKNSPVTIHRMSSKQFFEQNTETFDWVYVDGDHSYEGCLYDLEESLKIVNKDGMIFGDDYTNKEKVKQAVDEFVSKHNLEFNNFYKNQFYIKV